jgi:hypothetical protein
MPRKGKGNISAEGQELLEDQDITFTADWFLREGQGRELLGEWMKMTSVRSEDQRRMLRANSYTFPTNTWIHTITKGKESDRCDLCRTLWIEEGRFRTEKDLPEQTLGHIQHTYEALSTVHIDVHHQCWGLIHGELTRLAAPEWKLCVSGEKCLQTIWDDITSELKDMPYLNLTQDTIWNTAPAREMVPPDGITVLPPVVYTVGIFCILEHKRMSDVRDQYLIRAKRTVENQYVSLRSAMNTVIQRQVWRVEQVSFISGARSVDKQDLSKNLKFFRVSEASINSIYSKLAMRVFDVYVNILKCMYSTRFSGGATRSEASPNAQPTPFFVSPPSLTP